MNLKNVIYVLVVLFTLVASAQTQPEKVEDGYQIVIKTSAVCEMCKETIEQDLTFEKGVKKVALDVETKLVTIVYNERKTNPEKLRTRITEIGYNADSLKREPKAYEKLPFCCKDGGHGAH